MRKKGVIILIVIIAIFAVIAFFFRDRYIERVLEKTIQAIAGAKVEIDNFHFSLFKMECSWNRLQVANKNNPWYNILETGQASFDLETRPLFWRRVIIKEMVLENVRNGTRRTTNGSLPKKIEPPKEEKPGMVTKAVGAIEKQLRDLPVFDLSGLGKKLKVDSLIDVNNLATVQGYERLNKLADSSFKFWQMQLKPQDYLTRVQKVEENIKSLNLDHIKDVAALTTALKKLDDIRDEVNSLKKEVGDKYDNLSNTFTELQTKVKDLQDGLKDDLERAKQLAKLKDLDVKDISLLLFGAPIVQKYEQILGYIATVRKYLPTAQQVMGQKKVEKPPRFKGQDIHFPFHYRYPKFLLRNAQFSAATAAGDTSRAYFLEGKLSGLTNQPVVYNKPTRFDLGLMKIDGNQYQVSGAFDHRTELAKDSLRLSARNFGLGEIKLKQSKYFPSAVEAKKGDISLAGFFIGDDIDLKLNLDAKSVNFLYEQVGTDRISQIVRDVLAGLTQLTLNVNLVGQASDYKLLMNSNVDNVLANQVKQTIQKNLQEAQQQVENYVRAEVDKRQQQVQTIIEENRQKLLLEMDNAKQKVQEKVDEIEQRKKEIEERIEKEKSKVKDQAKDKLKDLLKKKP